MFRSLDHPQGATLFLAKVTSKTQLPEDDLRIEIGRSDFECFSVLFYVSVFVV